MRSSVLGLLYVPLLMAGLMNAPGCKREVDGSRPAAPAPSVTSARSGATQAPIDDAGLSAARDARTSDRVQKKFISCSEQSECPVLRPGTSCGYACDGGACRLNYTNVAKPGAGPCYGNSLRNYSDLEPPTDYTPPFKVACDLTASVYCETETHRCAPVRAIGARCASNAECGAYAQCANGKCAAAPKLGEACTNRCAAGAYCDVMTKKCRRLVEPGEPCTSSDACRLGSCDGHCESIRQLPCPVSMPDWNGKLSVP